jgi:hypothetical protein
LLAEDVTVAVGPLSLEGEQTEDELQLRGDVVEIECCGDVWLGDRRRTQRRRALRPREGRHGWEGVEHSAQTAVGGTA